MTAAPGVNATRDEPTPVGTGTKARECSPFPAPRPDLRHGAAPHRQGGGTRPFTGKSPRDRRVGELLPLRFGTRFGRGGF